MSGANTHAPFGAILAGGRSTRYGDPKAFARVGGERIIDRVRSSLASVTTELILIANDHAAYEDLGLPIRGDVLAGAGALAGIHAALRCAAEEGRPGVLAVACDMPFLSAPLLQRLLDEAHASGADIVAPESGSRRGVEPLCAYYRTRCAEAIEASVRAGDVRVVGFWAQMTVRRLPAAEVASFGEPDVLFMNVNTREERDAAERILAAQHDG